MGYFQFFIHQVLLCYILGPTLNSYDTFLYFPLFSSLDYILSLKLESDLLGRTVGGNIL